MHTIKIAIDELHVKLIGCVQLINTLAFNKVASKSVRGYKDCMKVFSTFSGVEGIGLGLPEDWERVGFSEFDKYASQVLAYHYPTVKNYGDITKINWDEVPDFDLLTGGSPCQDFSIAGKRRGLSGNKSSLAWEYIRGLRSKQPKYFLWENVKGVMSSRGGWDFANLLTAFSESGYSLWWQVLNAKDFGVPQNRERIFVFGTREGSAKEVLFVPKAGEETGDSDERDEATAIYFDDSIPNATTRRGRVMQTAGTLTTQPRGGIVQLNKPKHSNDRVYSEEGVAPTLNTMQGGNRQPKIAKTIRVGGRSSPHDSKQNWDSYQIDGQIRRLTPKECERLMSWPDDWTKNGSQGEISEHQRYKMCGNGVVSAVVRQIIPYLI